MIDTGPEVEAFLNARYAAMTGSERLMMALKMFETAQQIVLSSLDSGLDSLNRNCNRPRPGAICSGRTARQR